MFARLSRITAETRSSPGFFEESSVALNVLHHWDFETRDMMVERGNSQYKLTAGLGLGNECTACACQEATCMAVTTGTSQDRWDGDIDE